MSTFNGCGTTFYGRKVVEEGYITTKYLVFVYIPIIPLSSYLILSEEDGSNWIISSSTQYQLVELDELYKPQLRNFLIVWAVVLSIIVVLNII